ncbi:hypothetical protein BO94DRAFT_535831 [Aspergillus sclerotioniger CBS 115572]|uniref:Uncharacterized protein n=1 Tax=Aspergillus sclerotioniger CBS 115572 TaxID=1450535 RepID=A0A317WGU3_9EURO|nr:hypothetical protein BO94DRAFT_535831 [Aspergillus sclerotioniger CBS 115572]PWY85696.1 hypothetical protein BO94DRAFT_535831 [Aspergillus sclerotioniger CBS 115572]
MIDYYYYYLSWECLVDADLLFIAPIALLRPQMYAAGARVGFLPQSSTAISDRSKSQSPLQT